MKNYYQILGVAKNASRIDIRKAYLQKAKMYHPDLNSSPSAPSKFKEIQEAYNTLYDANRRKEYDSATGKTATSHNYNTSRQYRSSTDSPYQEETFEDQFRAEAERLRRQWQQMEEDRYRMESEELRNFNKSFGFNLFRLFANMASFPASSFRFLFYLMSRLIPLIFFPLSMIFYFNSPHSGDGIRHRSNMKIVYDSYGRAYTFDSYGRRYRIPEFDRR